MGETVEMSLTQAESRHSVGPLIRIIVAMMVCVAGAVAFAPGASAHAVLIDTSPSAGQSVDSSPTSVSLTFNDSITVEPNAIRLFDVKGRQLDIGTTQLDGSNPKKVVAPVPRLNNGTYVVAWRANSPDSHPVNGAFTFAIGTSIVGADARSLVAKLVDDNGSTAVGSLLAAVRWVIYLAVSVSLGGLALVMICWREGLGHSRFRRAMIISAVVAAVGSLLSIAAQGAYAAARPMGALFDSSLWGDALVTRFGQAALVRTVAMVLVAVATSAWSPKNVRASLVIGGSGAVATIVSLAVSNHGLTGRWPAVAIVADVLHLAAMAIWVGGLVALFRWVVRDLTTDRALGVVQRFSTSALFAVGLLTVSGVVQSIRQVGGPTALTTTTYGQILMVKVGIVMVAVGMAWVSRGLVTHWARAHSTLTAPVLQPVGSAVFDATPAPSSADAPPPEVVESETRRALRRSIGVEVLLVFAVLIASTLLSNTIPAIEAVALPLKQTVAGAAGFAEITVEPARAGLTELHVTVTNADGSVPDIGAITVSIRLAERELGPLDVPMERFESVSNHFQSLNANFPFPGTWEMKVVARIGQSEDKEFVLPVTVR